MRRKKCEARAGLVIYAALMKLRVSFINFLNSVPLGWGFTQGNHRDVFQVDFDVPSQCARRLATGEADIGLIPVIEYQRIPDLKVLPGISISAKREVKSVLFVSRKPIEEIRTIALDTSSRTSVALLRILLETFYHGKNLEYRPQPPLPERMLQDSEAALIIGNPALNLNPAGLRIYDLAREWLHFTGLPFVFAFWAVRGSVDLGPLVKVFYESKASGLAHLEEIVTAYSRESGKPPSEIREYLTRHLDYSLDEANLKGLQTFFERAHELGMISHIEPLHFYPLPAGMEADDAG